MIKKIIFFVCSFTFLAALYFAQNIQVKSPDGKIDVKVSIGGNIRYSASFNGNEIIEPSGIAFNFKQAPPLGQDMEMLKTEKYEADEIPGNRY